MERFPALDLVVRYGAPGAIALALLVAAVTFFFLSSSGLGLAAAAGLLVGGLAYLVAKCAVEMVTIVTEMLVPR